MLGFDNNFAVHSIGRGGGIAIMWKGRVACRVGNVSNNHIDVEILEKNIPKWRLTCFYGYPERSRRRESWDFLMSLAGDFNDLLHAVDKMGKNAHPQYLMDGFRRALEDRNLIELDLEGCQFTWEKSKGTSNWVRERLDRAFADASWWHKFPLCKLSVIHSVVSDHDPLCLELCNTTFSRKKFRFKFENIWLKEPNFHADVSSFWQKLPASHILSKLVAVSDFMAKWGYKIFHKFRDKVKLQKKRIDDLVNRSDEEGVAKYFVEKEKLNELLCQEETYWKQRAKMFWLAEGDSNSKIFHAKATSRKRLNHIPYLIDDA